MSKAEFIWIVANNLLSNCPVTERDIMAADDICGPDLGSVKGKTVHHRPLHVESNIMYTPLPPSVHEHDKEVTLMVNTMFVNVIPLFVSLSQKIKFGTMKALDQQYELCFSKMSQINAQFPSHGTSYKFLSQKLVFQVSYVAFLILDTFFG